VPRCRCIEEEFWGGHKLTLAVVGNHAIQLASEYILKHMFLTRKWFVA
jgi:hypothetical protein